MTNRSLQLLVVNTSPEDVLGLAPEESDEPQFAQFRDRVSGLRMGAKDALQNRAIVQRLGEIRSADTQLSYMAQHRNRAAFQFFDLILSRHDSVFLVSAWLLCGSVSLWLIFSF